MTDPEIVRFAERIRALGPQPRCARGTCEIEFGGGERCDEGDCWKADTEPLDHELAAHYHPGGDNGEGAFLPPFDDPTFYWRLLKYMREGTDDR